MLKRLRELNYQGTVKIVAMPADVKDLNGLHIKTVDTPGAFEREFSSLLDAAEIINLSILTAAVTPNHVVGDLAISDRFLVRHGHNFRHCPSLGFITWDGRRWTPDERETANRATEEIVRGLYDEAAREKDAEQSKALRQLARSQSRAERIRGALTVARTHIGIRVAELDAHPFTLNVANGEIDLRTGMLRPHSRDNLLTKVTNIPYHADAKAPRWERFLCEIFRDDGSLSEYIRRAVGYSLTADQREQVFHFLHGAGANGKSTFISILLALAGEYGQTAPASLFLADHDTSVPTDEARLRGARFVATAETAESRHLDEEKVKKLTGGDRIVARFMRRDFFEFDPSHHIWLYSNYLPRISGTDWGIWRRLKLISFCQMFKPDSEPPIDPALKTKLLEELPGILAWMVRGAKAWYEHGLDEPSVVSNATKNYRAQEDVIEQFIDACCLRVKPAEGQVAASALYTRYKAWATGEGYDASTSTSFGRKLADKGFLKKHEKTGNAYAGLILRPSP
jgi:putative DNA primase/helicase